MTIAELIEKINANTELSCDNNSETVSEIYNRSKGNLEGLNCPLCNNRGDFIEIRDGYEYLVKCKCMAQRELIKRMEKSGLGKMLKKYSLAKYTAEEPWQKKILDKAKGFMKNPSGCFFIGGQPGSGKTHICTAIVNSLMREGKEARYMLWREESISLKNNITESEEYFGAIEIYKKVPVLYIDDFLRNPMERPSNADMNLAFEIINARYNADLVTLISSEITIEEIYDMDIALAGRIMEMSGKNLISIAPDTSKNYRIKMFTHRPEG